MDITINDIKRYIKEKDAESVLNNASELLAKTGPRLTGTDACRKACNLFLEKWKKTCDQTVLESFKFHRDAFLSISKILPTFYIVSFALILIGGHWVYLSALLMAAGFVMLILEFFCYHELIDFLFPETTGQNIVGTINPKKETRQTLIFSAHYDSPYVFHFLDKTPALYKFVILIGILYYLFFMAYCVWAGIIFFIDDMTEINSELQTFLISGLLAVIPFYFFITREVSPGFGDNLSSVFTIGKLAEIFTGRKDLPKLDHTRLIFLAADAEESGLRGARNFVKEHKHEFNQHPHYNFNFDSIYKSEFLAFFTSDINGTVKLSKEQSILCSEIAELLGYDAKVMSFPIGGGGTDAAEFAKAGMEAVSMIGMDTELKDRENPYHTRRDVQDTVEPKAVLAALQIAAMYAIKLDAEIGNS